MSQDGTTCVGRWGISGWAVVIAAFAIGFLNFPMRVVGWSFDYLPGDGIDNRLNNFVLEHGYRYLTGRTDSFWDAPAFYPIPHVTACSDAHIGLVLAYSAFRTLGLSPEGAFQAWFVLGFVLNFVSAAWALRRLGVGAAGTAAGAYIFTFGLPVAAQLMHAQLFPRFLVPPAVVFAWEFLWSQRLGRLLGCLACIVGQFYVSVYIGILLSELLAMELLVSVLLFRSRLPLWTDRREWLMRVAVLLIAGGALFPLVREHRRIEGAKDEHQIRDTAPTPRSWLTPRPISADSLLVPFRDADWEHQLFPGFLPLTAVVLGLIVSLRLSSASDRMRVVAVSAWSVTLLAIIVTNFGAVWLYKPMLALPGGGSLRAIGRIVLVLLFPMAVLVAFGADEIIRQASRKGRLAAALAGIIVCGLVAADQWLLPVDGTEAGDWEANRYPLAVVLARQGEMKEAIARHPQARLLYAFPTPNAFPFGDSRDPTNVVRQLEAMRAAQDMGIPTVNGYSGYFPSGWTYFRTEVEVMNWLEKTHAPSDRMAGLVYVHRPEN